MRQNKRTKPDDENPDTIQRVKIDQIQIGVRFRKDFGDLNGLAAAVEKEGGLLQPIGVTPDNRLVFGERRLRACREILGWETIPARIVEVGSILDAQIDENTLRRDYSVSERVAIVEALRSYQHGGDRRSDQLLQRDDEALTVDQAAKRVGLGGKDDYYRSKRVIDKGVPELVEAMDRGDISVSAAAELAALEPEEQRSLLAEKREWSSREIAERQAQIRGGREARHPLNGQVVGTNGDGHGPVDHKLKPIQKQVSPEPIVVEGDFEATAGASVTGDVVAEGLEDLTYPNEGAVLRAAKEIRQGRKAERIRRQTVLEEEARAKLDGEQTWTLTGEQDVVPCDLLIADPPQGILADIDWDNPPEGIEAYTRDWCSRWSGCGADFIAVFWCQGRLWEGKRWFDEALTGYEFQQVLVWHAVNNCGPRNRGWLKQTWVPIFLYRRTGSERQVVREGKDWSGDLHNMDCHIAAMPQTVYRGEDLKRHPCQKPVGVMKWLINALSEPGEMVASVFCGVSPCGVAALQLGRQYHGVEVNPEYRRIAEGRLAAYGRHRPEQPVEVETIGPNTVVHGDCMDLIPRLPDRSVNLVVTSPPYAGQRDGHYPGVPEAYYPEFTVKWMTALWDKLADDGSVMIVLDPHVDEGVVSDYVLRSRLALHDFGWKEHRTQIWHKPDMMPLGHKWWPRHCYEDVLWFSKGDKPYCNPWGSGSPSDQLAVGGYQWSKWSKGQGSHKEGVARVADVITVPVGANEQGVDHPAQFPVPLAEKLIQTFCPEGGVVIDCFAGSGSSLVAASKLGRSYYGFDIVADYCEMARGRVDEVNSDGPVKVVS